MTITITKPDQGEINALNTLIAVIQAGGTYSEADANSNIAATSITSKPRNLTNFTFTVGAL